ncbi:hypothetical protein AX16_007205 [Volvariella volvacea WC 439]|nr:hypothetical protein AX16_007205 [Volvariella volvacea WC 439]
MVPRALRPLRSHSFSPWFYHNVRCFSWSARRLEDGKTNEGKLDSKAYSKTLRLPKTTFPLWSIPSKSEVPYQEKTCEELYRWQWKNARGPLFVLHDGPPYANGSLHMGHALNKIIKDIINRFNVSLGRKVHYIPGWDCHGLPIENKALQELGKDSKSLPAHTIREAAKVTAIREVASQKEQFKKFGIMADWSSESTYRTLDHGYEIRQLRIFQQMVERGLIYRHYRPVHYSPSSRSALAEAELVYKEDHVSHSVYVKFEVDQSSPIRDPTLKELCEKGVKVNLLVWTTTPWTLTANMGIAVHHDLTYALVRDGEEVLIVAQDRLEALEGIIGTPEVISEVQGANLVDIIYHPILASSSTPAHPCSLKIVPSSHVTSESGTGLVHCAPAHGAEDYHVFRSLNLLSSKNSTAGHQVMLCHVDGEGKFSKDVAEVVGQGGAERLVGLEVLKDGSKTVVEMLKEVGKLVKIQRIKHKYPYDWKTDEPIIVTATSQWFANLDNIKDDAVTALQDVTFVPPQSRNRLESFTRSRSEWCISRQRVWGVPIPSLHRIDTDQAILNAESLNHILGVLEKKGVEYWWNGPVEEFLPSPIIAEYQTQTAGASEPKPIGDIWRKGMDTMDVWFDSGTSWSMLAEMLQGKVEGWEERRFDADVCLEGSDQHRGWFQSQLLTAVGSTTPDKVRSPYGTLITHGMVLDQHGKKMSKSLGNVISPLTIVDGGADKKKEPAYGADILRLWAATVEYWRDMSIGPTILAQTVESLRKIRNSARFMLGNLGDKPLAEMERVKREDMGLAEKYVMHELYRLEQTALESYAAYNFPKVMSSLSNFANITLSSLYFDITKDCLYADHADSLERRAVVTVLDQTLRTMTSVLAPVLPHLAEEIHATWNRDNTSVFMKPWTPLSSEWNDAQLAAEFKDLLELRKVVLALLEKARGNKQLKSSLEAEVDIILPGAESTASNLLRREESFLKTLFITSDAQVLPASSQGQETANLEWVYEDTVKLTGALSPGFSYLI